MTPHEFLKWLQGTEINGTATLSPGPLKVKIGESDRIASDLLLWMQETYPHLTVGDAEDALQAALWWVTF